MEVFDEDKAVEFIRTELESKGLPRNKYNADDILEVIDTIWDYYEDNGFLDLDMSDSDGSDEAEADKETLIAHVKKMIAKDKLSRIEIDDIPSIVEAELAYEALCDQL